MKISKIFFTSILAFFALVLVSSFANAALELTAVSIPSTTDHNKDITLTFTLKNTGTNNETDLDWTQSTLSQGTFKQLPTATTINVGETKSLSTTINVPKHASGTIVLVLKTISNSSEIGTLSKTITINNAPQITLTKKQDLTNTQNGTMEIKNEGNVPLSLVLSETTSFGVVLSKTQTSLAAGQTDNLTVSLPQTVPALKFGDNPITIKGEDASQNVQTTASFNLRGSFCKAGEKGGNLSISRINIDNEGEGDDNEWHLLDTIEVEVEVENNGDDDVKEVIVKLGLFDSSGSNQVNDLDFENTDEEKIEVGNINDGSDETVTFTFRVPADIDDGDYKLAIKAYGDKVGENNECTDVSSDLSDNIFERIDVERESDAGKFIAFENIVVPIETQCGDTVSISTEVFNIGDEDQDQTKITLQNRELSVDKFIEIRKNLNQGDKESVTFEFLVPQSTATKSYLLILGAQYDYRSGSYRESLDEDIKIPLKVLCADGGGSGAGTGESTRIASITAQLDTDNPMAGKELVVISTITNLQSIKATFVVGADGFQSWASLTDISERIIELNAGQSKEITFTFDVDDDAKGEQSFSIDTISGDKQETKQIKVEIAEKASASKPGFSIGSLGENSYLWIIGAVNVILIILIIVVAVRISRK